MAGTVNISRKVRSLHNSSKKIDIVTISWTADASDASVPNTTVPNLNGYLLKAITNPGSTAPTDNYDIELLDAEDSTVDALGGLLGNRHTSNSQLVFGIAKNSTDIGPVPPFLCGDYTFKLTNNSVNSATGTCILFLSECL